MTENFELEDGSGTILLENGTDNYRLDFPIIVKNDDVGVVESSNKQIIIIKNIASTIGLTGVINKFAGFVKTATQYIVTPEETNNKKIREFAYVIEDGTNDAYLLEDGTGVYLQDYPLKVSNSTVQITETPQKVIGLIKYISSTIGLTEASQKVVGFVKVATQFLVSLESTIVKKISDVNYYTLESGLGSYILEDDTGYYAIDNLIIVKNINSGIVGLTDALNQINGTVHWINETVGLTEVSQRLRDMVRTLSDTVGFNEGIVRARDLLRNVITNVQVLNPTEAVNTARVMFRNITTENVGITEVSQRLRAIVKTFSDTVGLVELRNFIEGIVKIPTTDIIGLTVLANRIRDVFISHNLGIFTQTDAVNIDTFTATDAINLNDMTTIASYNSGDFIIIDDD